MINIQKNIPLAPHTTFKIGGPAKYFVEVKNKEELKEAMAWARDHHEEAFMMGEGSNLLIADAGVQKLVVLLGCEGVEVKKKEIKCFAGCKLMHVVETARDNALQGMERMAGIPGSVGGAVRGNAGAFGTETKDVVREVVAIHRETLEERIFTNEECAFSYRMSYFKKYPEWVVAEAVFALSAGDNAQLDAIMKDTVAQRNAKQYQDVRSAGSFFVNPVVEDEALRKEFEQESGSESRGSKVPAGGLLIRWDFAARKSAERR